MKKLLLLLFSGCALFSTANAQSYQNFQDALGSRFHGEQNHAPVPAHRGSDLIRRWNQIAIDASGVDHTPLGLGEARTFGEQIGPGRSSRAMAIVHIAIFDAINAVIPRYRSYTGVRAHPRFVSLEAAISQAAHDTLVAMYPSQKAAFDTRIGEELARVKNIRKKAAGVAVGSKVAAAILKMRTADGAEVPEPLVGTEHPTSDQPGHWRQDPVSLIPLALGAHWGECKPFVLQSGQQFRTPAPPSLTSDAYTTAFNEVKNLGGDGTHTATQRTAEQSFIGVFWAYDGTPSLCAPPRLYNQVAVQIADQKKLNGLELARLLALVNVAMADAAVAVWESKYYWDFWRPVGGIREADPGTGPTGAGDANPATIGIADFMPLGAPASNLVGPNFTPPFPAYPSGHAGIGGALFQTLRRFFGTDRIGFTFVSDEFNGVTKGNDGQVRPYIPRSFSTLSQAEEENGQSRIYLGIHWSFDKTEGIKQGRLVADYVFDHIFRPRFHRER